MEELIGILALESHRHQCLVIGEDLGTVPEGFRERMTEAAILSYRVLPFEQDAESGALVLPAKYPYRAHPDRRECDWRRDHRSTPHPPPLSMASPLASSPGPCQSVQS